MEDIIKTLKNMSDDTTVSKFQLDSLLNYVDSLEDEAELGRKYKKSLNIHLRHSLGAKLYNLICKAFSSVAQVMTAKELLSFKEAFTKNGIQIQEKELPNRKFGKTVKAPLIFKLKVMTQKQIIQ